MSSKKIVAKFGGSSVKDCKSMERCAQIVSADSEINLVILSATYNTTNELEEIYNSALNGKNKHASIVLDSIKEKHLDMAGELIGGSEIKFFLKEVIEEGQQILSDLIRTPDENLKLLDQLYGIGERLSSRLFYQVLKEKLGPEKEVIYFDARQVLKTDSSWSKANPCIKDICSLSEKYLSKYIQENNIIVTQGFIGSNEVGDTTTLGREGSDYSAALFAEALGSEEIQIWSDIPGVASGDPRKLSKTKIIPELSYEEATALTLGGSKVLFPRTMEAARRNGIPIIVSSSLNPELGGTIIRPGVTKHVGPRAISIKEELDYSILTLIGWSIDEAALPLEAFNKGDCFLQFKVPLSEGREWLEKLHLLTN